MDLLEKSRRIKERAKEKTDSKRARDSERIGQLRDKLAEVCRKICKELKAYDGVTLQEGRKISISIDKKRCSNFQMMHYTRLDQKCSPFLTIKTSGEKEGTLFLAIAAVTWGKNEEDGSIIFYEDFSSFKELYYYDSISVFPRGCEWVISGMTHFLERVAEDIARQL